MTIETRLEEQINTINETITQYGVDEFELGKARGAAQERKRIIAIIEGNGDTIPDGV